LNGLVDYHFRIFRYDALNPGTKPRFSSYLLQISPEITVLAALLKIRDEMDGTLAFRYSCRSAICGSCAMVMNGTIGLACRTQLRTFEERTIIIEPLPNLEIIKDLVVDLEPFFAAYRKVRPWLMRKSFPESGEIRQSEEERERIERFVGCILCAACYSACPVPARNPHYIGPAAFAKLARFLFDSRDERSEELLEELNDEAGLWGCDTVFKCIEVCPKEIRPTDAIVDLRKMLLKHKIRKLFRR